MEEEIKISKVRPYLYLLAYNNEDKQFHTGGNMDNTDSKKFSTGKFQNFKENLANFSLKLISEINLIRLIK